MEIDLNADVGEGFGVYGLGNDEALLSLVSSANIACGFHAGDPQVMERTVSFALRGGAALGAHPGYPDLQGFGRRSLSLTEGEVFSITLFQVGALRAFARAAGAELRHVKPHGALYNDAAKDPSRARGIVRAVKAAGGELRLVGLPGSQMEIAAGEAGIPYIGEFFADRAYLDDGTLVPRSRPGSVILDEEECVSRVHRAVRDGTVLSAAGTVIPIRAETVCLHGDNPKAMAFARRLRSALEAEGITVRAPGIGLE